MQGVARLALMAMALCAGGCASQRSVWLRCTLTETLTTRMPNGVGVPTSEDIDHTFVFVFNRHDDTLMRYDDGRLQDLTGLGLIDGLERTGSVVVTPTEITYNYSLSPHSAEFSQTIDRTTLAIREQGSSVNDTTALAAAPRRAWTGTGQCTKIQPLGLRQRQI